MSALSNTTGPDQPGLFRNGYVNLGNLRPVADDIRRYFKSRRPGPFILYNVGYGPIHDEHFLEALSEAGLKKGVDFIVKPAEQEDFVSKTAGERIVPKDRGEYRATNLPTPPPSFPIRSILIHEDQATKRGVSATSAIVEALYLMYSGELPPVSVLLALNADDFGIGNFAVSYPPKHLSAVGIMRRQMPNTYNDLGRKGIVAAEDHSLYGRGIELLGREALDHERRSLGLLEELRLERHQIKSLFEFVSQKHPSGYQPSTQTGIGNGYT